MTDFDAEELPTRPDASSNASALLIAQRFDQLAPIDQRKLAELVECWFTSGIDERILLEELAKRMPKRR